MKDLKIKQLIAKIENLTKTLHDKEVAISDLKTKLEHSNKIVHNNLAHEKNWREDYQ